MMGARCDIPNLGDVRGISGGDVPAVDVLTASTPCQSFSEALPNAQRNGVDGKS
jgi:site-specific DNA-cytosine methylase